MKEILQQYAQYNLWVNKRIIEALQKLSEENIDKEITSSFSSVRKTVYHVWSAEYIWLQRLQLTEQPVWIETEFKGSFEEACADWLKVSGLFVEFVTKQYDDKSFEHVRQYYDRHFAKIIFLSTSLAILTPSAS